MQSAKPDALQKRLEAAAGQDDLSALASPILRAFRESIPADTEGAATRPVPVSLLIDGNDALTITYDLTKEQETQAYEAAKQVNESQALYQIDLNHDRTAALVINGTAYSKAAFETVYAEVFSRNPAATQAELNLLTADEMTRNQVLREHAEAVGIDADAPDMESRLWEAALKNVAVGDEDFAAALQVRQQEEDAVLAADAAEYARMLEEGKIASAVLPEGSRFVKHLIIPVDMSGLDEILNEMNAAQKRLDEVSAIINDRKASSKEIEKLQAERDLLARQVSQLNSDRKLLLANGQRAKEMAADIAQQIRKGQTTFEAAAALVMQDEAMPAIGYAVFKGAVNPGTELVDAALALEKPGDVSEPLQLADGFHLLYYSEEITGDSGVIQTARDALRQEALQTLRKNTQESLLAQWISEAEVVSNVK